jgi:hypothetical protein
MKRIATLAVGLGLLIPSSALAAGSSTCQAYNPQLCSVVNNSKSPGSGNQATAQAASSTLPFTGLDVALLAAGGGILLSAGLVFRRLAAPPE